MIIQINIHGLYLWCSTSLSIICHLYHDGPFYWWRKSEYQEKTIDLPKVTDELYNVLYRIHLAMSRIRTHKVRMIGTNCIGSCKSNYHTITTTTAPVAAMTRSCFIFVMLHCRRGKFMN